MPDGQTQRASYRCAIQESREGILTLDGRDVRVELLDESAEGLGLLLDGLLDCYVGQSAILRTAAGRSEVRIMNAQVVASDAVDDSGKPVIGVQTRVGTLRLKELPVEPQTEGPIESLIHGSFGSLRRRYLPFDNPLLSVGVPVATVALLILGLVWALEHQDTLLGFERREMPAATDAPLEPGIHYNYHPDSPTTARPHTVVEPSPPHEVVRWSRPEFLIEPEIALLLALTPPQQDRLRELRKDHAGLSNSHAMGKAALAVLTPEQRKQWFSMLAEPRFRASRGIALFEKD